MRYHSFCEVTFIRFQLPNENHPGYSGDMSKQDEYGFFGPEYSFADNIPLPGQVGVRKEASFGAILDAVGGINYYVDTIAFGGPTMFDHHNPQPMGVRYFLNTGMRCSNGATMSEYFDGVTKGDLLGSHVANALQSAGLPGLKGLAPGMLENARDALDPRPIFHAVTATGYPVCQKVVCPVGDVNGSIQNAQDADQPFIVDPVQYKPGGGPTQTRWVQAYDNKGSAINITKDEFAVTPKCYNADGSYMERPPTGCVQQPEVDDAGDRKHKLCRVVQRATMPPSLTVRRGEGFTDMSVGTEDTLMAVCVVALLGVALWAVQRK